ncbi:hypothetical protein [Sedimenticola sp.]|uniref:hypothetical protein n=1 Tax=Sedimenticola sp. TaxID=1940285 RepID=UPI003D0DF3B4
MVWRYLTGIAAVIFCSTSLAFTVGLWVSIPGAPGGQVVAGLTAVALELCKFSFAPFGLWLRAKGKATGYALLLLWPFLVILSIAATVGFLSSHTAEQQRLHATGTLEYRTLQQQLNSVSQQIATLNGVIAADADNGYRQRAIDTAQQLDILETRRNDTLARLKNVRENTPGSAQATFASLAALTLGDVEQWRHWGFLGLAVITDIVGLVALLAFNSALTTGEPQSQKQYQPSAIAVDIKQASDGVALSSIQTQLAERIRAGEFGQHPVLRKINREIRGGNAVVKPVFEFLLRTGELKREGQGFVLTTS